jgi:hypothetical protein
MGGPLRSIPRSGRGGRSHRLGNGRLGSILLVACARVLRLLTAGRSCPRISLQCPGGAEAQNRRRVRATSYQGYWGEGAQLLGMIVLVRLQTVQGVSVRGEEGTLAADPAYP